MTGDSADAATDAGHAIIDVLVPTCNRPAALAVTLTALGAQTWPGLRIVIADQSDGAGADTSGEVQAVLRYLRAGGRNVAFFRRLPRRGMAEQRAFLLAQVRSPYCLFVDDDVILEPDLVARLYAAIREESCGFVGSALHGLSYVGQRRPLQEAIEFWDGPVTPETVRPGSPAWTRHHLHSAANLFHVQGRYDSCDADGYDAHGREADGGGHGGHVQGAGVPPARPTRPARRYKVAWVGGCVLFDTAKLKAVGGFDFWHQLPSQHCGEDVLAQQRVMARYGGCAILPSGAYHMELPTTVTARAIDAPYVLPLEVPALPADAALSGAGADDTQAGVDHSGHTAASVADPTGQTQGVAPGVSAEPSFDVSWCDVQTLTEVRRHSDDALQAAGGKRAYSSDEALADHARPAPGVGAE